MNRNLVQDHLAAIRTQHSFDRDLVARAGFGHIGAGAFQTGPAAFADQVEIKLHAANAGHVVRIVVDAAEAFPKGQRRHHRGRLSAVRRRKHVLHRDVGISVHADPAVHAVGRVFAVLVHSVQRVEHRGHHGHRTQVGVVQHFVVKLLVRRPAMDVQA